MHSGGLAGSFSSGAAGFVRGKGRHSDYRFFQHDRGSKGLFGGRHSAVSGWSNGGISRTAGALAGARRAVPARRVFVSGIRRRYGDRCSHSCECLAVSAAREVGISSGSGEAFRRRWRRGATHFRGTPDRDVDGGAIAHDDDHFEHVGGPGKRHFGWICVRRRGAAETGSAEDRAGVSLCALGIAGVPESGAEYTGDEFE